jgi:hypothetical protein
MATDAVPNRTSGGSIAQAGWFRFLVRAGLALLAFGTLWFAADRYSAFIRDTAADFTYNDRVWLSAVGATVVGGALFGLASWLPFTRVRFWPSRLLLAAVALVPLVHFWWVWIHGHQSGGLVERFYWFDASPIQFASGLLAGVAIASGFRARRSGSDTG